MISPRISTTLAATSCGPASLAIRVLKDDGAGVIISIPRRRNQNNVADWFIMSESPISYVSLALSLLALGLFVLSGFQNADDTSKSHEEVATSFVFYYDEQTGVARVRDGVAMACVGIRAADCTVDGNTAVQAQLKVAGGIQ